MIKSYSHGGSTYFMIQLSFQDKHGVRHQPKFKKINGNRIKSLSHAKILEQELRNKAISNTNNENKKTTFREYRMKFLEYRKRSNNFKNSTIYQYDGDLTKWLSHEFLEMDMMAFTRDTISHHIDVILPSMGATDHTRKRISRILRTIFSQAVKDRVIPTNPAIDVNVYVPEKPMQVFNTNETIAFLTTAKRLDHPFYFHWAFGLLSGMRSGELYSLRWTDIDLESRIITIHSSWSNKDGYHSTKSRKVRVLPISNDLHLLLMELKNVGPFSETLTGLNGSKDHFNDLVLPRSSAWKHGSQSQITKEFCKKIGIKQIRFHDCRSTFITNLLANGATIPQVMSIVGHEDMETTNRYLRLAGVDVKGVTENLSYSIPEEAPQNIISLFKQK